MCMMIIMRSSRMAAGRNSNFLKNGGLLLEKIIASSNGRCNPICNFSAKQLEKATNNYNQGSVCSKNRLGKWYKGCLEGRVVSICKTSRCLTNDEIVNDIAIAAQLGAHKNVLRLIGYCLETARPILVYEYVESCVNLHDLLHDVNGTEPRSLPWKSRLKIAREIAYALSYLHTAFPRPIAHRFVQPSNVFLDQHNFAKLSNFSRSISIPEDKTLRATFSENNGYFAPELEITEKVDVYCFGTLLLELLTGGRSLKFYKYHIAIRNELEYYVTCHSIDEVVDKRILAERVGLNEQRQWEAVVELALVCVETCKEKRPTMVEVTKQLVQIERSSTMVMERERFFKEGSMLLDKSISSANVIHVFSAKELKLSTNNYDPDCILSCSDLGLWYKGCLKGKHISICRIHRLNWHEHVDNELKIAMQLGVHENVLKLLGCCLETQVPCLVYESAERGMLLNQIEAPYGHQHQTMPWNNRLKITRQVADGLAYLHTAFSTPIIHGDLTTLNIFLNEDYVAKIFNFSHSIWIPAGKELTSQKINEIELQKSPDFANVNETSEKSDVFNFGNLLLQLLAVPYLSQLEPSYGRSGDINHWMNNVGGNCLVNHLKYFSKCLAFVEVVDPRILADEQGLYLQQQWQDIVELVCRCLEMMKDKRTVMAEVAKKLKQIERSMAKATKRDAPILLEGRIFVEELISLYNGQHNPLHSFSAEELKKATDCYGGHRILNCSNLGIWYEGHTRKGKLSLCRINSMNWLEHVKNEFRIAIQLGARKNVLKLVGYCLETPVPTLVYDFAENGTLWSQINSANTQLPLKARLKIAKQIAHEVAHFHDAFSPPIIHGNIITANIFLDKRCDPKISCFPELKLIHEEGAVVKGYMPPEFMTEDGVITEKFDIYTFGVLLIELLVGRKLFHVFDEAEKEGKLLFDHLKNYLNCHSLHRIVDPKITAKGRRHREQQKWEAVIELAFKCMVTEKERRPAMVEIARELCCI